MTRLTLLSLMLGCACSADEGRALDQGVGGEAAPRDQGMVKSDVAGSAEGPQHSTDAQTAPPGVPGAVCTQQDKTCGPGQLCVFLESWNAPRGTCVIEATGGCTSWNDPRCDVAGYNYGSMCSVYTWNNVTSHVCLLLCEMNGTTYDCPPLHTCKKVNKYDLCIPQ